MAEWTIASDCKSDVLTDYLGSNPSPSTKNCRGGSVVEQVIGND